MYYGTPPIITNGLVLNLDTQSPQSIPNDPTVNLFNLTENIPTFPWQSNNGTRVTSSMAAPFGPGSASLYSATAGFCNIFQERTLYQGTYNLSWYIKYINQRYYSLILEGTSGGRVTFDILNGTVVAGSLAGSGTSPVIEPAPNGYYRISLSLNITTSSIAFARPLLWTGVYNGNSFSGSQAYVWGPQLSRTSYATPYISSSSTVLGARTSWQDLSGNNNIATLQSSSISGSIPVFPASNNRVLQFNGTSSFASVNSPWSYLSSSATEVFFSANAFGISTHTPIAGYDQNDNTNFSNSVVGMIYISNSDRKIRSSVITTTQVYRQVISNTVIQSGSYYHVVLNKDTTNGALQLYVNGILESTTTFDTGSYAQWPALGTFKGSNIIKFSNTLSSNPSFDSKYLNGTIPVFRLYNKILSQSEITQNYNALKSRFGLQ